MVLLLLRDGSHSTQLVLGGLLAAAAARLALLASRLRATTLLLADDTADVLALESQTLTLHLENLGIADVGRRDDAGRSSAAGTGDGAGVVVEGVAEEEVVVGEIRRGTLFSVGLG